jgi:hypothetical protein
MIEVDFADEGYGSPTVSRGSLSASEKRTQFFERIATKCNELAAGVIPSQSPYAFASAIQRGDHWDGPVVWYQPELEGAGSPWAAIQSPGILGDEMRLWALSRPRLGTGEPVIWLSSLRVALEELRSEKLSPWNSRTPDRVCLFSRGKQSLNFVPLALPATNLPPSATFPSVLHHIAALSFGNTPTTRMFLNPTLVASWDQTNTYMTVSISYTRSTLPADFARMASPLWSPAYYLLALLWELPREQLDGLWANDQQRAALKGMLHTVAPNRHPNFQLSVLGTNYFSSGEWKYRRLSGDGFVDDPAEALRLVEEVKKDPGFHIIDKAEPKTPRKPKP